MWQMFTAFLNVDDLMWMSHDRDRLHPTICYILYTSKFTDIQLQASPYKHDRALTATRRWPTIKIFPTWHAASWQQLEIVLFLLLLQRYGTACQATWHQLRRWRCSRTGSRRTCSAADMKLFDRMTLSFPSNSIPSRTVVLAIVFTI